MLRGLKERFLGLSFVRRRLGMLSHSNAVHPTQDDNDAGSKDTISKQAAHSSSFSLMSYLIVFAKSLTGGTLGYSYTDNIFHDSRLSGVIAAAGVVVSARFGVKAENDEILRQRQFDIAAGITGIAQELIDELDEETEELLELAIEQVNKRYGIAEQKEKAVAKEPEKTKKIKEKKKNTDPALATIIESIMAKYKNPNENARATRDSEIRGARVAYYKKKYSNLGRQKIQLNSEENAQQDSEEYAKAMAEITALQEEKNTSFVEEEKEVKSEALISSTATIASDIKITNTTKGSSGWNAALDTVGGGGVVFARAFSVLCVILLESERANVTDTNFIAPAVTISFAVALLGAINGYNNYQRSVLDTKKVDETYDAMQELKKRKLRIIARYRKAKDLLFDIKKKKENAIAVEPNQDQPVERQALQHQKTAFGGTLDGVLNIFMRVQPVTDSQQPSPRPRAASVVSSKNDVIIDVMKSSGPSLSPKLSSVPATSSSSTGSTILLSPSNASTSLFPNSMPLDVPSIQGDSKTGLKKSSVNRGSRGGGRK